MAKSKTPKTRNAGTMTEAQYFQKIRSTLRRAFRWWIPMKLALDAARRKSQSSNKKLKYEYQCAHCKKWFPRKDVEIDHKIPCGTLRSYDDIPVFLARLTAEDANSYQVLCRDVCHKAKTQSEILLSKSRKRQICLN